MSSVPTASNSSNRSTVPSPAAWSAPAGSCASDSGLVAWPSSRSTCVHGQNGGAIESSQHWPHATSTDRSAASSASAPRRAVLPIPGSPADQHDPAPSVEGAVERGLEPSQRLVASDQVCTATHDR